MDIFYAGTFGREGEFGCASEHEARLKQMARELAAAASLDSSSSEVHTGSGTRPDVNKDCGHQCDQLQVKMPKYSGKADWEAFHAQFELLTWAAGWS